MKLSARLRKICQLITPGFEIADIGTDHGYIPIYLVKNNIVPFAIASDVNKGPLENARKEVLRNNLENKIDLRLGSGLSVVKKGEVKEAIIAGMGGTLISDILNDSFDISISLEKLILQPMQNSSYLRKYLIENKFEVMDEVLVKEQSKIYEIIVARYGGNLQKIEDEIYYEIGLKLIENKDPLLDEFIDKKINEYKMVIEKIKDLNNFDVNRKIRCYEDKINKLKEMKTHAS
ncbi:tRNA (adenine22-N1)-methyltransferase [Alkalithermobacter thermoalcaliphilus JW-YL-7 = DSM 7308]|uniref:tRNA (Adenine22-N1)-methyltransferase n=1 Tax=Alkalithermobacter thermoalcaliphilus JW-YL-7 = DSM 7308 TaxID=1121328 RepID=A0A150FQ53_CLOPD|nr:protein of unknown function DUF633 [[Clostridium] paradoxum JW-YL-7 = DSM 7308]SHK62418.1 tRNA (adenine22-N1)-methyltransferase [[Clostridium] paradoxum JW-YL-7 = DSM 7308]